MNISYITIKENLKNNPIPYQLLLLADESIPAINKYIHNCTIYLIKKKENPIGVCAIQPIDAFSIEIKNLAITRKYRNHGIGKWCLQKIGEIYCGKEQIVGTGDSSFDAIRFHKRNGHIFHAIRRNYFLINYDHPILENGFPLIHQIVLKKVFEKGINHLPNDRDNHRASCLRASFIPI